MKKITLFFLCSIFTYVSALAQCETQTYTGEGTYYQYAGGGNCSFPYEGQPSLTGAMNEQQYADSEICGACVEVTGRKGSLVIRIEDRCPECAYGDIDLTEEAFPYIDNKVNGRVDISWKLVPCPVRNSIKLFIKEGSHQWWTAVQVRNHRYPVQKMEYKKNGRWINMPRTDYNYFVESNGLGKGPFEFRITDINGNSIIEKDIPLVIAKEIAGTKQFTACDGDTDTPPATKVTIESVDAEKGVNKAKNLLDGNKKDDSRWSAQHYPKSVVFDLGAKYKITGTKMWTYKNRAYKYKVATSNRPNSGFRTRADKTNNRSSSQPLSTSFSTTARYVKLTITGAHNYSNNWVSINEFEIQYENEDSSLKLGKAGKYDSAIEVLSIFPNPAKDAVTIKNMSQEKTQLSIYNLNGQLMLKKTLDSEKLYLKTGTDLNAGIYIVKAIDKEGKVQTQKLILK